MCVTLKQTKILDIWETAPPVRWNTCSERFHKAQFKIQFHDIDLIFFFQMDLTLMEELLRHISFYDTSFLVAVIAIVFNPLFWNVVRFIFIIIIIHIVVFVTWEIKGFQVSLLLHSNEINIFCRANSLSSYWRAWIFHLPVYILSQVADRHLSWSTSSWESFDAFVCVTHKCLLNWTLFCLCFTALSTRCLFLPTVDISS